MAKKIKDADSLSTPKMGSKKSEKTRSKTVSLSPHSSAKKMPPQRPKTSSSSVADKSVSNKNSDGDLKKRILSSNKKLGRKKNVVEKTIHEKIETLSLHAAVKKDLSSQELEFKRVLVKLVVNCNNQYEKLAEDDEVSAELREAEQLLQEHLLVINENVDDFNGFLNHLYQDRILNIEQKARLRESVVRLFSCVYFGTSYKGKDTPENDKIIDVYGIPVFSRPHDLATAAQDLTIQKTMEGASVSCGYFGEGSSVHVLTDCALEIKAFSDPLVLSALATMYGETLIQPKLSAKMRKEILQSFYQVIEPYRMTSQKSGGFIIPCVRIWTGSHQDYKDIDEIAGHWNHTELSSRTVAQTLWNTFVGHSISQSVLPKGSLLVRPPAPPLVAQAQALAWGLVQQVYERLGTNAFSEINFISINDDHLCLRAYNHRNKIVAQSDVVPLFDVITAPDDFSLLLKEECEANGPHSWLREKARQ